LQISVNGTALKTVTAGSGEGWWMNNNIIYIHLNKRTVAADCNITLDELSSIEPVKTTDQGIRLYPNPASNMFTLELCNAGNPSTVTIYNGNGEKVFNKDIAKSKKIVINTQSFSKGAYLINVENGTNRFTEKLIIE